MIDGDRISSPTFHCWDVREFLQTVDRVLSKGDRAEVVPGKDGIKVLRVRRETVKHEDFKKG